MNESMVKYTQKVSVFYFFMCHTCKNMKVASKCVLKFSQKMWTYINFIKIYLQLFF